MIFETGTLGVRITAPDQGNLRAELRRRFAAGEGFALATLNLDHLVKLQRDAAFRAAYAAQDLVTADGNPVVWLSRLAKRPVSLVPGADLVVPMAELARNMGVPIGLAGSTEAALAAAAEGLRARVPGVTIAAQIAPPMGFDPESPAADRLLDDLAASGARLVFLALGAPKQEILAARGRVRQPALGFASIGAGLDFIAGTQTRAPAWVRGAALEWVWRLVNAPSRLGPRYARCIAILPGLTLSALRLRRAQNDLP